MDEKLKRKLAIEPWAQTLEERLSIFNGAKKDGKKVALYFVKAPDSSTFRYRCYNVAEATMRSKKWQAVVFYRNEIKNVRELIPEADLLVFGRQSRWDSLVKSVVDESRENGKKVLFDLDDLVFDKKYLHLVLNTIGEMSNIEYWAPYFDDIYKTAKSVDGFLVTNDFLGKKIEETFSKPYKVIMNSLNNEQLAASWSYLELGVKANRKTFDIGYFSGSPTHVNDFEVALPELLSFLDDHSDSRLKVVGLMEFDERAREFLENGQIVFSPPVDFRKLQRAMCEVDVNIAPLIINDFTNCKSELKFFEAAAVETVTIASPTYTFKKSIKEGETGFLAQPGEWYEKLEYLYKNPKERQRIAEKSREYVLNNYCGEKFLSEIEKSYDYFAKM